VIFWIFVPFGVSITLALFNRFIRVTRWIAAAVSLGLALAAAFVNFDELVLLGGRAYELSTSFSVLGRQLVLNSNDRFFLVLVYGLGAFWFLGAPAAGTHRLFAPLGLAVISILVASLSVEPFLYAAPLVELAVLVSIPMLVAPGQPAGQGVLRYLIFMTLGMPFILLGGWALNAIEINPANETLLLEAMLLLGLGLAFWLAIFPFYTWVPLLSGESQPYIAGFLFSLLPTVVFFLMFNFLDAFAFLRNSPVFFQGLQLAGTIMVATAGIWAAFQRDLTRLFGYAVIQETGFALLAISLHSETGLALFAAGLVPRLIGFGLFALSLSVMQSRNVSLRFEDEGPAFRQTPIASLASLVAIFSISGLPLLAGFPVRQPLLEELGAGSIIVAIWALIGSAGMMYGGLRYLSALFRREPTTGQPGEGWYQIALLSTGVVMLFVAGVFPSPMISMMLNVLSGFANLF
jgi:formate hydrogenlyase subunit 3/multisubunit Na+/H+ antiporter MnhD subunit